MVSRWARICPATSAAVQLAPAASRLTPVPRNSPNTTLMATLLKSVATAVIAYVPARRAPASTASSASRVTGTSMPARMACNSVPGASLPPSHRVPASTRAGASTGKIPLPRWSPGPASQAWATGVNEPGTS